MLHKGVIRRSSSQWSSPLHMVRKKDGSWQPCSDNRQLNLQTMEDKYPLPNMADLAARLDSCNVFSKLDLCKVYLQVPVTAADVPNTAIIMPFGLFEFLPMPFGLPSQHRDDVSAPDVLAVGQPALRFCIPQRHPGR
jgi:hypothetical protein